MNRIVIIEDEKAAGAALVATLKKVVPEVQVQALLRSVAESVAYLQQHNDFDLLLSDVQLTDGLSFAVFQQVQVTAPVIFITGYDKFMLNAFTYNGIDYLLKPVTADDLQKALHKYQRLQQHFSAQASLNALLGQVAPKRRSRLLVKRGLEHISLPYPEVVLLYTENKLVYVVDRCGRKFLSDKNLSELEAELDAGMFFRVNRQYIVNINYIRSFRTYERVKLQVDLTLPDLQHMVIVSQETAPDFRKWIAGA